MMTNGDHEGRIPSSHPQTNNGFFFVLTIKEALPGVLGNRGNRKFISGEQGNIGQILRRTGEQRQYWGTGNIRKHIFNYWGTGEQANLFQGNKGTDTPPPPGRASLNTTFYARSSRKR